MEPRPAPADRTTDTAAGWAEHDRRARLASLFADARDAGTRRGDRRLRDPTPSGRRPRSDRRHVVVVGGHPRLPPPGARPGRPRPARRDRPRHVRRDHPPRAVELAELLVEITPDGLDHVFLADSGSVSVEVAIKMALQHARGTGRPERSRLLTVRSGYHGDTLACMSVCDPVNGMHSMFADVLPTQLFAPAPTPGFDETVRSGATSRELGTLLRPAPRRDRRRDHRTDRPGRRRDALLRPRVPRRASDGCATTTTCC